MGNKIILAMLVSLSLIVSGCAQTSVEPPPSIMDLPAEKGPQEAAEIAEEPAEKQESSTEVKGLISLAEQKVQSLSYKYKGPETNNFFYEFFVKWDKIKYAPIPDYKTIDVDDDAYDTIYISRELETAEAYCESRKCRVKGKKADLDYNEANILTPLDWLNMIEFAEKAGEELIEQRNTWVLSANGFKAWVDTFFGVPLQAE